MRGFDARFDPSGFAIDGVAELDPIVRWTLHASREALREAGIEGPRERAGVVLGNLSFPTAAHAAMVEAHWLRSAAIGPRSIDRALRIAGEDALVRDPPAILGHRADRALAGRDEAPERLRIERAGQDAAAPDDRDGRSGHRARAAAVAVPGRTCVSTPRSSATARPSSSTKTTSHKARPDAAAWP